MLGCDSIGQWIGVSGCCPLLSPPGTVPLRGPSGVRLRGSRATERSGSPLWLNIISGTTDTRRPDVKELPPVFYWPRPSEATVPLLAAVGSWAASEGPGQGSLMVMWQPLGPARARQLTLTARQRSVEANTVIAMETTNRGLLIRAPGRTTGRFQACLGPLRSFWSHPGSTDGQSRESKTRFHLNILLFHWFILIYSKFVFCSELGWGRPDECLSPEGSNRNQTLYRQHELI